MDLVNKLFKGDRSLWIIFMLLCLVSLVEVYSATSRLAYMSAHYWTPIFRHATFLLLGFGAVLVLHNIPSKYFSLFIILLPVSIILLIVTQQIGVSHNEANRGLSILGVQFQPQELGKLSCVVFVAFMLSRQEMFTPKKTFWWTFAGVGATCALIFPQNLSTSLILFTTCFLMVFVGHDSLKRIILLFVILALAGILFLAVLHFMPKDDADKYLPKRFNTWKERVDNFLVNKSEENKYVLNDDNWQENNAKIAIARGGILIHLPGSSVQRDFLPEAYSDFIYAIIIEELGLVVGGIGVLMLYIFLLFRVAIIARRCEKLFPKYLALGCGLLIVIQAFTHMAISVNLLPVSGQPLPLISRGGTSTMLTCFYFGILLSVSRFGAGMGNEEEVDAATEDVSTENFVEAENSETNQ